MSSSLCWEAGSVPTRKILSAWDWERNWLNRKADEAELHQPAEDEKHRRVIQLCFFKLQTASEVGCYPGKAWSVLTDTVVQKGRAELIRVDNAGHPFLHLFTHSLTAFWVNMGMRWANVIPAFKLLRSIRNLVAIQPVSHLTQIPLMLPNVPERIIWVYLQVFQVHMMWFQRLICKMELTIIVNEIQFNYHCLDGLQSSGVVNRPSWNRYSEWVS